jgi:hypothetical protein
MIPNPDHQEKIERLVHQALRELPERRAPHSLEHRVFAEISRRAALPWWRKSFVHWPLAARAGFIILSAGLVKLALMFGVWIMASLEPARYKAAVAHQFSWMDSFAAVFHALTGSVDIVLRNIPPFWLYGGLAFLATMYFALFGLGAAAYKAIHPRH